MANDKDKLFTSPRVMNAEPHRYHKILNDVGDTVFVDSKTGNEFKLDGNQYTIDDWIQANRAKEMTDFLNNGIGASLPMNVSNIDKIKNVQQWLKDNGFLGEDGKELSIDGIAGKNTFRAFNTALDNYEWQKYREAVRNSPAAIIEERNREQPRRDMFSGVNLGIPDYMQPEDYENNTPKIVAVDYLGRPIYQ